MAHDRRLAWLLGVDIATTVVAIVVMLAAYFFVVASGYFLLLAAMVAGAGLIMAAGYLPLREGRTDLRLHQADRHGAARHRLREGFLRGRGAFRDP